MFHMFNDLGGKEVMVFIIGCLMIIGIIFLSLMYRGVVHYRLNQVPTKQSSRLFKTKLVQFKQKELRKSMVYLFAGIIGILIVLTFSLFQLFQLETYVQELKINNQVLQGDIRILKKKKISTKSRLKDYPPAGLELKNDLDLNHQTIERKEQTEEVLSKQLQSYVDDAQLVISSSNEADSLTMTLTGTVEETTADLVILGKNISAFMREAEGVKEIVEVHISINTHEGHDVYKGTYTRNDSGQFVFQSELRKGKG